jgi:hypothetical protein
MFRCSYHWKNIASGCYLIPKDPAKTRDCNRSTFRDVLGTTPGRADDLKVAHSLATSRNDPIVGGLLASSRAAEMVGFEGGNSA